MGKLTFHKCGLFTTIQDVGRSGYKRYGVPESGVMDRQSATLANLLVKNPPQEPVIEITLIGPQIAFSDQAIIAITGAELSPCINDQPASMNKAILVEAGQVLSFGKPVKGVRCYLGISGGLKVPKILNSFSQYPGITVVGRISNNEEISYDFPKNFKLPNTTVQPESKLFSENCLAAYPGPEFELLDRKLTNFLFNRSFTIGVNSRMGYQLENSFIPPNRLQIITSQVVPGTIQLTPSGKLMALMRDAQVTGGYPRVLQLTDRSINQLAQKKTGDKITFELTTY